MKIALEKVAKRPASVLKALKSGKEVTLTYMSETVEVIARSAQESELERIMRHPAFGMWADREDMKDPNEWRRNMRHRRGTEGGAP